MFDKYGLLDKDVDEIRARDKNCVYCHKIMIYPCVGDNRRDWATIEHLNYLPPWNNPKTVAICCGSCNSSRSNKKLRDWFKMPYCVERNINESTIAIPVKEYLRENER
jgi:hypothetical protein